MTQLGFFARLRPLRVRADAGNVRPPVGTRRSQPARPIEAGVQHVEGARPRDRLLAVDSQVLLSHAHSFPPRTFGGDAQTGSGAVTQSVLNAGAQWIAVSRSSPEPVFVKPCGMSAGPMTT